MVFSSSIFLLYFFPCFLLLYYLSPHSIRNIIIVIASILFYAWGGPKYIFFILISIVADFILAKQIYNTQGSKRKLFLSLAVIFNLSFLFYYKYANFFLDNINSCLTLFGADSIRYARVVLPIGISFFTFQKISYLIDIYREVKPPMKKISDYFLYVMFFTQLIAGPIIRYNTIADQIINRRKEETIENKLSGFYRFVIGLSKKVLIANVLGAETARIFSLNIADINTSVALIGITAYAFQIYFDFSGYSDMALGMARMMGFTFPENFNNPYISQSITEFWRRWHITLSTWMRDYLYIPLGGNRLGKKRMYLNLWIVFFLSGLWHGASWNFVLWGSYHGLFIILDKLFLLKLLHRSGKYPSMIFTFIVSMVGWSFFCIEDISTSFTLIAKMFSFDFFDTNLFFDKHFLFILCVAFFFSFIRAFKIGGILENIFYSTSHTIKSHYFMTLLSIILFVLCLAHITSSGFNPFIYFRF